MKRWLKVLLVFAVLVLSAMGWVAAEQRISRQNLDETLGMPIEEKSAYFTRKFPTRAEIERYLYNKTILLSHPPILNEVTYFDSRGQFFQWHGREITKGSWRLVPRLLSLTYRGDWRLAVAYSLCRDLNDGTFTEDNCYLAVNSEHIFPPFQGEVERQDGDVFGLAKADKPPFPMPTSDISISLLRK